MGHIFISYSHKDKEYVHKLEKTLQNEGFEVWIDDRIHYGSEWPKVVERNLDASDGIVIVLSKNSHESDMVQNEVTRARDKKIPIFPLLLDGDNWLIVQTSQYVDVKDYSLPTEKFYKQLAKITPRKKSDGKKSEDIPFSPVKSQEPSVLVIGHRLDADVQCVLWDEDEPNIADYDIVIVDLTLDRKPLLPPYRPRLWQDPQFDISSYLNWIHTRSRIESLALSGGTIFFILNSSFIKHVDSPASCGRENSRLLPFTFYGVCTPIGTSVSLVDSRFGFYFHNLGSWNFVFGGQVQFDFEHTSNYEIKVHSIANNRADEMLGISIEVDSHKCDKPGWIHVLPPLSMSNSFESTKLLVANLGNFV
jgi:hypothetical protein